MALMTRSEYARHRGVSPSSVTTALLRGRISFAAPGKVDSDQADLDWARNTNRQVKGQRSVLDDAEAVSGPVKETVPDAGDEESEEGEPGTSSYQVSRAKREKYQAALAEIAFMEKSGKLVDKEKVAADSFEAFRRTRDALMSIPDRTAAILAAETDVATVQATLTEEIRKTLTALSDELAR